MVQKNTQILFLFTIVYARSREYVLIKYFSNKSFQHRLDNTKESIRVKSGFELGLEE